MSKIGKKPIVIPEGVTVTKKDGSFEIKGKGGTVTVKLLPYTDVEMTNNEAKVKSSASHKQGRANWGTMAALLRNAVRGVSEPFKKQLDVQGIGFKAAMDGKTLVLNVGLTHPVKYVPAEGVVIAVEKNLVIVSGINKQMVGQAAAEIRKVKKPEPYKGKGIRYVGEKVRRKEGKKVAGATGTAA